MMKWKGQRRRNQRKPRNPSKRFWGMVAFSGLMTLMPKRCSPKLGSYTLVKPQWTQE